MSSGPYLYDDDPAPLHTGTPRRRNGLLLAIFGGTAALAVLMVLVLPMIKGSAEEQAQESAGVFLAALAKGDTATAHQLLCEEERARFGEDDVAAAYLAGGGGEVGGSEEAEIDGASVQEVRITWDDGSAATLTVIREDGPRVCGIAVSH
jgi:hypothetical protein